MRKYLKVSQVDCAWFSFGKSIGLRISKTGYSSSFCLHIAYYYFWNVLSDGISLVEEAPALVVGVIPVLLLVTLSLRTNSASVGLYQSHDTSTLTGWNQSANGIARRMCLGE